MKKKRKVRKKNKLLLIVIFIILIMILLNIINCRNKYIDKIEKIEYKYILVNKNNRLSEDIKPDNLVEIKKCSSGIFYLEKEAEEAYQELCSDSIKENLNLSVTSAYRSYDDQNKLYNQYLEQYGKSYADKYVAKAGYSEHQTGLSIDLKSLDSKIFKYSKEYLWIKDNSYKYGFIVRYQKGKEKITGYSSEEWHIRYVGKEAAKYIYDNNITFEEYYKFFLN